MRVYGDEDCITGKPIFLSSSLNLTPPEYHHQQLGGAKMWVNLIRITVPAVTGNTTPVYQDHYMALYHYHKDMNSVITLDTNAVISNLTQKLGAS
jgi:hypothetical protein